MAYFQPNEFRYWKGFNLLALLVWAGGFGLYKWAHASEWTSGAALPALIGTGLIYVLVSRLTQPRETAP